MKTFKNKKLIFVVLLFDIPKGAPFKQFHCKVLPSACSYITFTSWTSKREDNQKYTNIHVLTLSPPILLRLYTLPYWSNPPFLIFDIRALWRSGLSARAPECQKLKMVG